MQLEVQLGAIRDASRRQCIVGRLRFVVGGGGGRGGGGWERERASVHLGASGSVGSWECSWILLAVCNWRVALFVL